MATRKVDPKPAEVITTLKLRVKELEDEVTTLKSRLDELRKAKNTTITKREREIVEVGFPRKDPKYEAKLAELQKQMKDLEDRKNREIEELKKRPDVNLEELKKKHAADIEKLKADHRAEIESLRRQAGNMDKELRDLRQKLSAEVKAIEKRYEKEEKESTDHSAEIARLRKKLAEAEADNSALMLENSDVKERFTSLVSELSVKEAKWCETEEQLKLKLKQGFGDKYAEWMQQTESKIEELQQANAILRQYLHRSGHPPPPHLDN